MVKVIPAILTLDIKEIEEKIKRVEGINLPDLIKPDRVQIDIIDGKFADNRTIEPSVLETIDTDLKIDFHLMTKDPIEWVERCVHGMADRIIGQIELMGDQAGFVGKVQEVGLSVGLAIDIYTPVSKIDPTIINNLDVVLVMSVPAGFGSQKFDPSALLKVKELDEIRARDVTPFSICVDGGETTSTIDDMHFAGADEVVIGKRIFEGDLSENIMKFEKAAHKLNLMK
ncbi:hypothetical protein A3D00_04525 [Candidatus Woesebacteria bacterium RIFCSPHIGHO2_02_FULL_38_9]|uniref:Ribulose-phosphate 3-epimerase n=1 Tax=Candidatus Woesebacteria bacterium RIFCSPHIGHO2_01_FULL_39_28 TaxID=1802496 RepID=A0A1F7YM61_9BACT|nr:MAG: hypothetical protein A2627_00345 [Candidatus Woesebacteria bacterium RIFCSPHIGHO2_01_FULL_39_28]OGM31892.1 MAG: hypothetical protein A3D00_04525 [Candidatus Woesebacteria bacterium RIFCSPHIGHO2_02_FULL_38_9]OGM56738.1 MAG: hypothetical protein A3A50_05275 [Candidatus Woesebacteria bacterium RIFCSPLOWO2_01_FULL_38_20]